jgi:hypothetical protein
MSSQLRLGNVNRFVANAKATFANDSNDFPIFKREVELDITRSQ